MCSRDAFQSVQIELTFAVQLSSTTDEMDGGSTFASSSPSPSPSLRRKTYDQSTSKSRKSSTNPHRTPYRGDASASAVVSTKFIGRDIKKSVKVRPGALHSLALKLNSRDPTRNGIDSLHVRAGQTTDEIAIACLDQWGHRTAPQEADSASTHFHSSSTTSLNRPVVHSFTHLFSFVHLFPHTVWQCRMKGPLVAAGTGLFCRNDGVISIGYLHLSDDFDINYTGDVDDEATFAQPMSTSKVGAGGTRPSPFRAAARGAGHRGSKGTAVMSGAERGEGGEGAPYTARQLMQIFEVANTAARGNSHQRHAACSANKEVVVIIEDCKFPSSIKACDPLSSPSSTPIWAKLSH